MTGQELTLDDITSALRKSAGQDDTVDLGAHVLDRTFEELGYDSLALLETCALIEREHGIELNDSTIEDAQTPRALLIIINELLALGHAA